MHEYSLTKSLVEQVLQIAHENGGDRVLNVVVEMGPLSGIEPLLMAAAFEQCTGMAAKLRGARLTILEMPLVVQCCECKELSPLNDFVFVCLRCRSASVEIVSGEGLVLRHVELSQHEMEKAEQ